MKGLKSLRGLKGLRGLKTILTFSFFLFPFSFSHAATFTRPLERVATMDPAFSQSIYDSHAVQLVYETPLDVDYAARPYRLVPGACELPTVSSNGLVYTFRLRSAELTADDMVRALIRLGDPNLVTPNGWMVKDVVSTTAVDTRTVEIRLASRCHFFPWLMAMSPAAIVKPDGSGTGPYELKKWWKNHEMVFERREKVKAKAEGEEKVKGEQSINRLIEYSNNRMTSSVQPSTSNLQPRFSTVRYLVIDDVSTQWLMFLKGEIDFLGEVSRDNWDAVVGLDGKLDPQLVAQGVKLYSTPTMEAMYLGINMTDPVLGPSRKLRQALNAAFDYPAWERFYSGRIVEAGGPVPPGVEGRLDTPFAYAFNLEKARRLMREAGYPDGIDPRTGRRLVLTLANGRASQDSREAGELIASFYAKIGVRLELSFYTWNAFLGAVREGRVQMFRMGWVGDYPDAQNFLQLFHSKNVRPGVNHTAYANAEYDRAYDRAMAAGDAAARNAAWRDCQEILREDCPWVYTHFNKANSLVRPRVGNYVPGDFPYGQEAHFEVREAGSW